MLSLSLYAPHVAKILAYADCSIQVALTNADPRLCDCNRIIASEEMPLPGADQPDKQKDISLKADWKYVGVVSYQFSDTLNLVEKNTFRRSTSCIPEQFLQSVFRPPQG